MNEWKLPWSGACRCGQTRFQVSAPPLLASACHCSGCQRMSASAFSLTLVIPSSGFEITAGAPVPGGLHGATQHNFCPHCMSWMFTRPEGLDELVNLRVSMLDQRSWFVPFVEFWTQESLPWASTPAVHSYATQPELDGFSKLIEEFALSGARPKTLERNAP
jgi:hypothetical protein